MPDETISFEDFARVKMRVGRITSVEDFPKARKPAYKLSIDFGEFGIRRSSAQVTARYSKEQLMNRLVIAVTNFPAKQIADFKSEVLVLGAPAENGDVILLGLDKDVPLGSGIF